MRAKLFAAVIGLSLANVHAAPPAPATKGEPPSVVKQLIGPQVGSLESEIAALAQRRADMSGAQAELLELVIDMKIISRAIASVAVEAKAESELQIAAMLRASTLASAQQELDKLLMEKPMTALSPKQSTTLKLVNQATYKLNDIKSTGQMDELCSAVGTALATLVDQTPTSMRPDAAVIRALTGQRPPQKPRAARRAPEAHRMPAQLEAEARQMSVSPGLRRQLLALARATQIAKDAEQDALNRVLTDSVDLAAGLAGNFAVDPETRQKIESQLAEGIALYIDPRLRASGQKRLDALNPYRQLLSRVGKMKLAADVSNQFAPAFTWARANGPKGEKVIAAIEHFASVDARFSQIGRNPDLSPALQKAADTLEKKFARQKQDFVNDAQTIGASALSTGPDELQSQVDALTHTADALDLFNRVPVMSQTLLAFRPKLSLGFNKRVDTLVAQAQGDTPAADEAIKQLQLLDRFTQQVQDLSAKPPVDLTIESISKYGGSHLPAFDKKCQTMIGETVQEIATNAKIDESRMVRLGTASALRDALQEALLAEVTIQRADSLRRCADWPVTPAQLNVVLSPYQQAMTDAFAGFVNDRDEPLDRWKRIQPKYAELLEFLKESAAFLGSCEGLPTGLLGEAGKLSTPYENAPFSVQRYVGFMLICWSNLEQSGDAQQADAIATRLAKRLAR